MGDEDGSGPVFQVRSEDDVLQVAGSRIDTPWRLTTNHSNGGLEVPCSGLVLALCPFRSTRVALPISGVSADVKE